MKNKKNLLVLLVIIIVIIINFTNQYNTLIKDIENTARSKETQINRYIDLSKGFIDLLTVYGNDFFKFKGTKESELNSLLTYNPIENNYNLDNIEGTSYQAIAGNLTGKGNIPESGIYKDEINLALHLNQDFNNIYNKIPEVTWLYYTSENDFINIYPWISSTNFKFHDSLQKEKFYTYVTPENNPLRKSVWTHVYLDHAGKGLMVTLSSPIYCNDTFMGAVSLDFTNKKLSETIESPYEIYIIDDTNAVIATSIDISFKDVIILDSLSNISSDYINNMENINNNSLKLLGNYYVYKITFINAPWKMYLRVPVWSVIGKSILYTLPILIICLLLFFTLLEAEKRKTTEIQLKDSLKELTSYQKLLENAAKYDFLTSTVNRRGLIDIFNENIKTNTKVLFIMGDIDYFKQFNDRFGHTAGDKILKEITNVMQRNIRKNEVVCRWGGEEFIIMLIDRTYDEAMLIAEKIRKEIESTIIPWENSIKLKATMSFGVTEYNHEENLNESISRADMALYIAKNNGRNQVKDYRDIK